MERLLSMLRQQVDPEGVVTTLEPRSAKVIWIHTSAKPIALWHSAPSGRRHRAMTTRITHGISSRTHRLSTSGNKEIHLQTIVDRILDLHLRIGKRNLNQESPKRAGANGTETTRVWELSVDLGRVTKNVSSADVPAASTIHVKLRAGHPLFHHARPLEQLVIHGLPIMLCHGVGRVRTQVSNLSVWVPVVRCRFFGVPAVHDGRIGLVRRTCVRSYDNSSSRGRRGFFFQRHTTACPTAQSLTDD